MEAHFRVGVVVVEDGGVGGGVEGEEGVSGDLAPNFEQHLSLF